MQSSRVASTLARAFAQLSERGRLPAEDPRRPCSLLSGTGSPLVQASAPEILMSDSCRRNGAAILRRSSRHVVDVTSLSFDQPEDARQ